MKEGCDDNASDMDWEPGKDHGGGGVASGGCTLIDITQSWSKLEYVQFTGGPSSSSSGGYRGTLSILDCSDEKKSQSIKLAVPKKKDAVLDVILEDKQEKEIRAPAGPTQKKIEVVTNLELVLANPVTYCVDSSTVIKSVIAAKEQVFCCTLSMSMSGLVVSASPTTGSSIIFPTKTWIGRPFVDFLHPHDHNVFACRHLEVLGSYDLEVPEMAIASNDTETRVSCRVRRNCVFSDDAPAVTGSVSGREPAYAPVLLKLSLKRHASGGHSPALHITAFLHKSYYKSPNEVLYSAPSFKMRQAPCGTIDQISEDAIQLLGYLPQQLIDDNMLLLCHEDDLEYLKHVYVTIIREGTWPRARCLSFRMRCQNGSYLTLESEWYCCFNPRTRRVDSVIAKLYVIMVSGWITLYEFFNALSLRPVHPGPEVPDVFQAPAALLKHVSTKNFLGKRGWTSIEMLRDSIVRILTYWKPTTQESGGIVETGKWRPSVKSSDEEDERHNRGVIKQPGNNDAKKSRM